jgi:ferredoxin hydrogenase
MKNVNRRKFITEFLALNTSVIVGSAYLSSCSNDTLGANGISGETASDLKGGRLKYLPIQNDNPAIARWTDECEKCGECVEACAERQKVYGTYQASPTKHVCIHCGTCILKCEEGAMTEKYHWQDVLRAIDNPSKVVIASISPSVRVGIGDYFDIPSGSFLQENMVGACHAIGFDHVLDTNFSADLTILEEAMELQKRIQENVGIPQFTSCCPAWVKYMEIYYPSLLPHLSTVKSPIGMQGAMVKTYFAKKKGIDPGSIVHVAIAPCTAKKFEITRNELATNGMRSTDIVITTHELAMMLKKRNIKLTAQRGIFDSFMGAASGGGIIFGNTGGVTRAAIRTAYFNINGKNPPANLLELKEVQGMSGLREAKVVMGELNNRQGGIDPPVTGQVVANPTSGPITLNVAVCFEMANAKLLLDQVKNGSCKYHFIEVMACKGGCVGGAGQPAGSGTIEKRMNALNKADAQAATRYSHENPEVKAVYREFLGEVGGTVAKEYLHTTYNSKANLLLN